MQTGTTEAALADPAARDYLRHADPVLAELIDARPDFRPRAWTAELPPLDAFGTLIFQVIGQQLSVSATRTILARLEQRFGGRLPTPAELLAADPAVPRASGMSTRKVQTLRAVAQRFVDGTLSDETLAQMSDDEVVAALTAIPGSGRGLRTVSCSWRSTGPMCTSPATSRSDARFNATTASTICRRKPRRLRCPTVGDRIGALRSATCSHQSSTIKREQAPGFAAARAEGGPDEFLAPDGRRHRRKPATCLLQPGSDPAAADVAPEGILVVPHELGDLPMYNADVEALGDPEPVRRFKEAIAAADALLIATPEYNHCVPGVLKNAIDWASRPPRHAALTNKPIAIMGASTSGGGTARAQAHLRDGLAVHRRSRDAAARSAGAVGGVTLR